MKVRVFSQNMAVLMIAAATVLLAVPSAGEQEPTSVELVAHIRTAADYAATVLLDEQGQSRCEYNMIDGTWSLYEPAWHTGQIINALVGAFNVTGDSLYLRRARQAGDWWCGLLITDHPALKGMVRAIHMEKNPNIVFATVSDGTPGLFNLYRQTHEKKYADVPTSAGRWMLANMYIPSERMFYDNVDPVSGVVLKTSSPFWPDKKNPAITDVARVNNEGSLYKDMYEYTKDEQYKRVFVDLCKSLVDRQGPEGVWMEFTPNDKAAGSLHPRFNLWNAESLLEGYDLTGDRTFLDAATKTLRFYTKFQRKDGMIYYDNYLDGSVKEVSPSTSTAALAGILWMRLVGYGGCDEFKPYIERTAACIMKNRFSQQHPDTNLRGGIMNIKVRTKAGKYAAIQRDLGTSFGIRFLTKYYAYRGF